MGRIADAIAGLDKEKLLSAVEDELAAKKDPLEIVEEARQGLERVGAEFEKGNYFLMELMWASQIFKDAVKIIAPKIKEKYGVTKSKGRVLMGTVKGDIHDLGKSIVRDLLECSGYEVIDLGVDVPPEAFVGKTKDFKPQVIGLSALLTAAVTQAKATVDDLKKAELRDGLKVIIGGGVVGEVDTKEFGVDFATINANEGIRVIERWIAEAK
jgi:methylmalonyl-CoA mutase cobalamin-binding domain/chain